MQLNQPLFISIIIILTISVLLSFFVYKNLTQSAGAIYLRHEENIKNNDINAIQYQKESQSADSNFYIVSVVAEDLKVPFFGTAFHVNYDPAKFTYDHFSLGDYFTSQDDPLVLVNDNIDENGRHNGKITIGISLKRGQILNKQKGPLLKIFFKKFSGNTEQNQDIQLYFSNTVFSTFDRERKDIKNVTFYP